MAEQTIRIGIVGAGANTRLRHIPGFRALEAVELLGVVNRSAESTAKAAEEFGIPRQYQDWRQLVDDPDIDAILVGTWPNLHCDVVCAALSAGKHVLTEARMARNAAEAHTMWKASQAHPKLVAQIVPSPFGLVQHDFVKRIIDTGFLGKLREMVVIGADDSVWDYTLPLHWRQDRELSGVNTLTLGILHEAALRWVPPPVRVFAQSTTFEPKRPNSAGPGDVPVTVPDSVQVLTELEGGARGIYHFSGICLLGPGKQLHLYGSHGTIKLECTPEERLWCGRIGDTELKEVEVPEEERGGWRVEEEFVNAIRGHEKIRFTDFATGVKYMEFTEAVAKSAASGQPVALPLS